MSAGQRLGTGGGPTDLVSTPTAQPTPSRKLTLCRLPGLVPYARKSCTACSSKLSSTFVYGE